MKLVKEYLPEIILYTLIITFAVIGCTIDVGEIHNPNVNADIYYAPPPGGDNVTY